MDFSGRLSNNNLSVFFATFSLYERGKRLSVNGMVNSILWFFLPKTSKLLLLDQPHPESNILHPVIEYYKRGSLKRRTNMPGLLYYPIYLLCKLQNNNHTHISFKIRDLISVFYAAFNFEQKYDLFIGLESINTFAWIILRKFGKVKCVIYYVSDYAPRRYSSVVFNSVYLWLDRFCVKNADFTWDVSPAMKEGRVKAGVLPKEMNRIIHVPNALFEEQIDFLPISKRRRNSVVYMGVVDKVQGIDLTLKAFRIILTEKPNATLHIIGGTEGEIVELQQLVSTLDIENSIIFYGIVPPNKTMSDIIKRCYVGVGTYGGDKSPPNRYGD